jgi:hypothetical protein
LGSARQSRIARTLLSLIECGQGILLIPLTALAASLPRLRGVSCGDDFDFHLISWMEAQRSWMQGVLYPHWVQSANWGAGEPRFVFYPPLSWMAGALLGFALPWQWVAAVFIFLCLTATGLATRALAREFLPAPSATLAGILAAATPYAFFVAYRRGALSELAAAAWIPLLLLYAWRTPPEGRRKQRFSIPDCLIPLSLVLAGTWLTNAPTGVMASYLLAFAAVSAAVLQRQWWPMVRAGIAAPLGIGLAGFYLLPAAWEQRWIDVRQALDVGMRVTDSWLFARHPSPDMALHDHMLAIASTLVVVTTALALLALILALRRKQLSLESRHFWLSLGILIPVVFFLQLHASEPLWKILPKLEFLQFPWRWLVVLGTPYAIFLAAATPLGSRRSRAWSGAGWTVVVLGFSVAASQLFFQPCDEEDEVPAQLSAFQVGTGVAGTDEYAALGSDNTLVASGLPDACLVSDPAQELGEADKDSGDIPVWYSEQGTCDAVFSDQLAESEHKRLEIESDDDGFVVLRLRRYPAWQITVNGTAISSQGDRDDGLIVLPVSSGHSSIDIRWSTTPDVRWGREVSLAALLLLAAAAVLERRRTEIRLSS